MRSTIKPLALAIALIGCQQVSIAATPSGKAAKPNTAQLLKQMAERLTQLEERNRALEKQVQSLQAAQPADKIAPSVTETVALDKRVQQLETAQGKLEQGLQSDRLSENEPDLSARLKAVEMQALNMQKASRKVDALDGLTAAVSFTTVAQKPRGAHPASDDPVTGQLNYRGDVSLELPLAHFGNTEQKLVAQFRLGQGRGLNTIRAFAKPNATAFQLSVPDEATVMLAQAWYQASIPLPLGGHKPDSRENLAITFGKMDPFVFFDQNAAANDESKQFLNSVFVHNPLLDAGGDIGVDANGFTPGLHFSYTNASNKPQIWRASLGVFGAGDGGANYKNSIRSPILLGQLEAETRLFDGQLGHYRVYGWRNWQGASPIHDTQSIIFDLTGDPQREIHSGFGLSIDQRFGDGITLFGRYGKQLKGTVLFDRALTLGGDINGSYWNRAGDTLGLGLAWLHSSNKYLKYSEFHNHERVLELYYRYRVNKQLEISPDFQYIYHPAGSKDGPIRIFGLRAQVNY